MTSFTELSLQPATLSALAEMNFTTATPVQAEAIPLLLAGRDVLAQARTGTGKTAAFGIPMVQGAAGDGDPGVLALVLVPTRELALQVTDEVKRLARGTAVKVVAVYGGVGMGAQSENLRRDAPLVVVATPGRLLDHMNQRNVDLSAVRMLVLDEADRMLDMGFLPDVERIIKALPTARQTALFSATVPDPIRRIIHRFMRDPANVKVQEGPEATPVAEQYRINVAGNQKGPALHALLGKEMPARAIVFTRTKHRARSVARVLDRNGWPAVALQGNMSQNQRERALEAFREGKAKILVATDVASRGLDVPEVSHVVNYDLPDEPEAYVHRIGRTARMGRSGRAFTFVQPDQGRDAEGIERGARITMAPFQVDMAEVALIQASQAPPAESTAPAAPRQEGRFQPRPHGQRPRDGPRQDRQGPREGPRSNGRFDGRPQGGRGGGPRPGNFRNGRPGGGNGGNGGGRTWQGRDRRPDDRQGGGRPYGGPGGRGPPRNDGRRDGAPDRESWARDDSRGFNAGSQWQGSYGADRPANQYRGGGRPLPRKGGGNPRGRGRPRY